MNIDNMNFYKTDRPTLNFKSMDEEIEKFGRLLKMKTLEEMKGVFEEDEVYMSGIKKIEELVMDPEFAGLYDIEERRQRDILDSKLTGLRENKIEIAKNLLKLGTIIIEDIAYQQNYLLMKLINYR